MLSIGTLQTEMGDTGAGSGGGAGDHGSRKRIVMRGRSRSYSTWSMQLAVTRLTAEVERGGASSPTLGAAPDAVDGRLMRDVPPRFISDEPSEDIGRASVKGISDERRSGALGGEWRSSTVGMIRNVRDGEAVIDGRRG